MSNKTDIQDMLVMEGFESHYINRALQVYEKGYGHSYNVQIIREIIVRLLFKDKAKVYKEITGKLGWKWKSFKGADSFYVCIASEIFGKYDTQTRLKIRQNIHDYIMKNKENKQYFENIFCKYLDYTTNSSFDDAISRKKRKNSEVDVIDLFAICELYNVRIIVFEYEHPDKIVLSTNKCYVDCIGIPLIILSKIHQPGKNFEWGIITDTHDISNTVPPMMNLIEYKRIIENKNKYSMDMVVQNICNYWLKEFCASEVCNLVVIYMPKLNIRPIGLPNENGKDFMDWNEQMKNKRDEIMSYND